MQKFRSIKDDYEVMNARLQMKNPHQENDTHNSKNREKIDFLLKNINTLQEDKIQKTLQSIPLSEIIALPLEIKRKLFMRKMAKNKYRVTLHGSQDF